MAEYPNLNINSKNSLIKKLAHREKESQKKDVKVLLENCLLKFNTLWWDHKTMSDAENEKWVRNCSTSPLGRLSKMIDKQLLKPQDSILPLFIHGGVAGKLKKSSGFIVSKSTHSAGISLVDGRKNRWLLKLDLKRFFEQITRERVFSLFHSKFNCSEGVSHEIADLCCVPEGEKGSGSISKVIARGFATSVRLAVWCNLEFFLALKVLISKELKGRFPLMAIFIDDIGITAVDVSEEQLLILAHKIEVLAKQHGLIINPEKTDVKNPTEIKEYLGLRLCRRKIFISLKTARKRLQYRKALKKESNKNEQKILKRSIKGLDNYKYHTKQVSLS